ncbi:MAG: hypothetical protein JNK17_14210 [Hydrogenophaga sp.]|nr:hypothetical protein [Hydrogenophaga sp.]
MSFPVRPIAAAVAAVLLMTSLTGCGTLTGIPGHGGGKRFSTEQKLVAASVRNTLMQLDVSPLKGKKVALVFDIMSDEGGGQMVGGRANIGLLLSGAAVSSPVTSTTNSFQVFDLINRGTTSSYQNTHGSSSSYTASTGIANGVGTASSTTNSSGTDSGTSSSTSNGSSSSTSSDTTSGTTNIGGTTTNQTSSGSTQTTTNYPATTTTTTTGNTTTTQTTPASTVTNNQTSTGSNTTTTNPSTNTSSSSSSGSSSATSSATTNGSSTNTSTGTSSTGSNSTSNQTSTNDQTNRTNSHQSTQAGSSSSGMGQQVMVQSQSTQTKGQDNRAQVDVVFKGLGEYQTIAVPKSDASYLMGQVRNYLLLNGVNVTVPQDRELDAVVYVSVDVFGLVRSRTDVLIYNNELVKAETGIEMMAFDKATGKLIMAPRNASMEAQYREHYVLWMGPFESDKTVIKGEGLMADFSDLQNKMKSAQTAAPPVATGAK